MTRSQKFVLGALTGIGAALATGRMVRSRRAIDFNGRTVGITGGSRGLGLVLARQFSDQGAGVCLLARDPRELDRAGGLVAEQFGEAGVMTIRCDIRRRADVREAITRIL